MEIKNKLKIILLLLGGILIIIVFSKIFELVYALIFSWFIPSIS